MRIIMTGICPEQLLVAWMLCLGSLSASATSIEDCLRSRNQTELNLCMSERLEREEKKLGGIYAEYLTSLSESQRQKFKEIQEKWRNYMHSSCEFESSDHTGGSLQQTVIANCEVRLVRDRYEEIASLKKVAEMHR